MSRRSEIFFFEQFAEIFIQILKRFQEFKRRRFFVQILFIDLFYCCQLFFPINLIYVKNNFYSSYFQYIVYLLIK